MKRFALAVVLSVSITHFAVAQHHAEGGSSSSSSGSSGGSSSGGGYSGGYSGGSAVGRATPPVAAVTRVALILPADPAIPAATLAVAPRTRADRIQARPRTQAVPPLPAQVAQTPICVVETVQRARTCGPARTRLSNQTITMVLFVAEGILLMDIPLCRDQSSGSRRLPVSRGWTSLIRWISQRPISAGHFLITNLIPSCRRKVWSPISLHIATGWRL